MKFALVAAALALSSTAVLAEQDPNVVAANGGVTVTVPTNTNPIVSPVPEADSVAMLVAGVAVVGGIAVLRRRKK
jgi:LPXTG-motif cell wall-anchored protein